MELKMWAHWKNQSAEELREQYDKGLYGPQTEGIGYLEGDLPGGHSATLDLFKEAHASMRGAKIPASVLAERLPEALETVRITESDNGATEEQIAKAQESYRQFVEFCARKEKDTGEPVFIELWD